MAKKIKVNRKHVIGSFMAILLTVAIGYFAIQSFYFVTGDEIDAPVDPAKPRFKSLSSKKNFFADFFAFFFKLGAGTKAIQDLCPNYENLYFFGDGITAGFKANNIAQEEKWDFSWATGTAINSVQKRFSGSTNALLNLATEGAGAESLAIQLQSARENYDLFPPDAVFILVGHEDVCANVPAGDARDDVRSLVEQFRGKADVYVLGLKNVATAKEGCAAVSNKGAGYVETLTREYNAQLKRLAESQGASYIDLYSVNSEDFYPTSIEQELLAQSVYNNICP